ncbi:MAG: hypothetical protein ACJA0K_001830 [Maricaulis maris]|jgi:hypothetical protein|uniref:Uncharacterized protein n=1 Tax=Maricaulis maris (strain MCS10) TaxID=394221 RepID=Q0ASN5_MARMM|nr:hypothetical protein [Maricaulis maris]ABI64702.1 hypothetical protein Mmar10_0409 [Maricaulis maris MCS10]
MSTHSSPFLPSWLGRALVEGLLILFAVVLGFIVNEWREDVADQRAAEAAMGRVVAEIEANIEALEDVVAYHEEVVERIGARVAEIEASPEPVESVLFDEFPRVLPRGVNAPGLSRFAWEHAQQHGRLNVLPYERVSEVARIYEMQAYGVESTWRQIVDLLFSGPQIMSSQDLVPSLRFTQIGFTELASQERFLINQYQRLLVEMGEAEQG